MIVLLGESGSGKTTIQEMLVEKRGMKRIISYTTRKPREGEVNGVDYHFVSNKTFEQMITDDKFAEWDIYSQNRYYGSLKEDFMDPNAVAVMTPNRYRELKNSVFGRDCFIYGIYVKTFLGERIIRYIERCGVDKFSFDDKNEIAARVERDYGMFLGIEKEVDYVLDANLPPEAIYYRLEMALSGNIDIYTKYSTED